jgi:hypothetical protein
MRVGLQLPTAIIGLDVNDWTLVQERYDEMLAQLVSNGETGHAFDTVLREPAPALGLE